MLFPSSSSRINIAFVSLHDRIVSAINRGLYIVLISAVKRFKRIRMSNLRWTSVRVSLILLFLRYEMYREPSRRDVT